MIYKDPSKSIKSIVRAMGVSEFLIKQVEHEDICYFSNEMKKGDFFHHRLSKMKGKTVSQSF